MPYDPQRHHRRSIRLPGYDYTQPGAYFITIVTHERMPSFGEIVDGEMRLNEYGQIVPAEWFQTAVVRPYVVLHPDEFVVMPNHVHGIVWIVDMGGMDDDVGAQRRCAPTTTNPTNTAPTPPPPGAPLAAPHPPTSSPVRWAPSCGRSNPPPPNASTPCRARPARPSGNAIITNTSSGTTMPWPASAITSNPTPNAGPMTRKTRP